MKIFDRLIKDDFEQIVFCHDEISRLNAIIAIHDTTLGPAIGGVRIQAYSSEEHALSEVMNLAKSMTLKTSAAGLNLGGGKAVIITDPTTPKNEALLRSFGRFVEGLCGRIYIGEGIGTTVEDIETIHQETGFVAGLQKNKGGGGSPTPKTALGVFRGIQACLMALFGSPEFKHRLIAIQGVGSAGSELTRLISGHGAQVIVADTDQEKIKKITSEISVETVSPSEILSIPCDVLCPCGPGGILNQITIPTIKAKIVAGSANNQLSSEQDGELLHEQGITYAPDFIINAGGLISLAEELLGYNEERVCLKVEKVRQTLSHILQVSKNQGISTHRAAVEFALERIRVIREVRRTFLPKSGFVGRRIP